jgi:hypothetical protein
VNDGNNGVRDVDYSVRDVHRVRNERRGQQLVAEHNVVHSVGNVVRDVDL